MSARNNILKQIRHSLGREVEISTDAREQLLDTISNPERHPVPEVGPDLMGFMINKMKAVLMDVEEIGSAGDVSAVVKAYLQKKHYKTALNVAPALKHIPWSDDFIIRYGAANETDMVTLTPCIAAVAETGSIVVTSSPTTPVSQNFLPEVHIVLVNKNQIVKNIEDVWQLQRRIDAVTPRFTCLVTGPSRTADIEQTIEIGAHGPIHMLILLLTD